MSNQQLIPHLFRTEFTKLVAVLCKTFGIANIQLAEDLVSETFLKATETWGLKGVPNNPTAWLYTVAKNLAKDYYKHTQVFQTKVIPNLKSEQGYQQMPELDLSASNIEDSQLKMLFVVCNPALSNEAQITLALRLLCGFGIDEIASALLTSKSTINKRLLRAKEKFRKANISITEINTPDLEKRISNVLSVIYLLFNEGYFSSNTNTVLRKELCFEAMRLLYLMLENDKVDTEEGKALMALFCFHASRFDARIGENGETILYEEQDKSKWIPELVEKGTFYLRESGIDKYFSRYHLEANIAFWHAQIDCDEEEKWNIILQLYNRLLQNTYSPITALNRTYALAKVKGKTVALREALKINLKNNFLYHALIADLYSGSDLQLEEKHLRLALKLAPNKNVKDLMEIKLNKII